MYVLEEGQTLKFNELVQNPNHKYKVRILTEIVIFLNLHWSTNLIQAKWNVHMNPDIHMHTFIWYEGTLFVKLILFYGYMWYAYDKNKTCEKLNVVYWYEYVALKWDSKVWSELQPLKDLIFEYLYWAKKESINSVYIPIIYVQLNGN